MDSTASSPDAASVAHRRDSAAATSRPTPTPTTTTAPTTTAADLAVERIVFGRRKRPRPPPATTTENHFVFFEGEDVDDGVDAGADGERRDPGLVAAEARRVAGGGGGAHR